MTSDERERAEAFLDNGTAILKSWNEIFTELGMPSPTRRALIDDLLAFAREERARAYEQMRTVLMESEEFDYYLDWISDQITKLREEGRGDE